MAALLFARVSLSLLLRVSGVRLILTASTTFSIRIRKQTSGEMGHHRRASSCFPQLTKTALRFWVYIILCFFYTRCRFWSPRIKLKWSKTYRLSPAVCRKPKDPKDSETIRDLWMVAPLVDCYCCSTCGQFWVAGCGCCGWRRWIRCHNAS